MLRKRPPQPLRLSPVKAARREKLLDVAEGLFARRGFRAVTMESLADAAGMSKATLYGYFRDKDEAFRCVAERLAQRLEDVVRTALARSGRLQDRLGGALVAKETVVSGLVRSSPFADELFAAKDKMVAGLFHRLDREIEAMLAAAMAESGVDDGTAASTARLLFGAAMGIANRAESLETAIGDINRLVDAVIDDGLDGAIG